jgi:hypothetical protein
VSVLVGHRAATAARWRLSTPAQAHRLLNRLLRTR